MLLLEPTVAGRPSFQRSFDLPVSDDTERRSLSRSSTGLSDGVLQNGPSSWSRRYGAKHNWVRITDFPAGIDPPRKVRVYKRADHYILQWWDKAAGKNLTDRVNGDLVAAIVRAREIDERLLNFRSSGVTKGSLTHKQLVDSYVADLRKRVQAGEIAAKTVTRYQSALQHYLDFATQPNIEREFRQAPRVDRDFAMQFAGYLGQLEVSPNGHANTAKRPLVATKFVTDTVRGMFRWAADPDRGNLIPDGFRNPFSAIKTREQRRATDLFGEPDITTTMAVDFVRKCDLYQLRLFAPMLVFGLRAAEPVMIFREDLVDCWLHVRCRPELGYSTKGLRDKRFPVEPWLADLLDHDHAEVESCMLFPARNQPKDRFHVANVTELSNEYRRRVKQTGNGDANSTAALKRLVREAGGTDYDKIEHEYHSIAAELGWPTKATLKDLRHLFSTSLENAGVPTFYRRYLMGQSPGRSALVTYTHIDKLREQYAKASESTLKPIIEAIVERHRELSGYILVAA